jgi:hypothetical protein
MRSLRFVVAAVIALALSVGISAQSNFTGKWTLSFNTEQGARDAAAMIKQDGDALTGTVSSEAGEAPFKGTVKGKTFTVNFEIQTQQGPISIALNGELQSDDTLKGTFDFGMGQGDFTGKRTK